MVDFKSIDDRTNLAGTNRLELLMFRLNDSDPVLGSPLYGINVFKVREIMVMPELIQVPDSSEFLAGVANIRGNAIPVINLNHYCGARPIKEGNGILVVTEFNSSTQGFLVNEVDNIVQLAWSEIQEPPKMVAEQHNNSLTAMSQLDDDNMLLILDVEMVIAEILGSKIDLIDETEMPQNHQGRMVFYADDSNVARQQVGRILDRMGIIHESAKNGLEAYNRLMMIADQAEQAGIPLSSRICGIITDVEMPEMDGYVLTGKIKADPRFNDIPVMMHTSLSASENLRLGMKVGADAYIPKLKPKEFSETLDRLLTEHNMRKAS